MMNALILGGTYFIGRALVRLLIESGWNVSILNRGTHLEDVPPSVTILRSDRAQYLDLKTRLDNRSFDVVYDLSGYKQDTVEASFSLLNGNVAHYIFCSSIAVCKQPPLSWPITEDHEKCSSIEDNEYGYNKWNAEVFLNQNATSGTLITSVRPTYVYGPFNYSRRETYILERLSQNKPVVISGNGENILQFGYVDDLAMAFMRITGDRRMDREAINVSGKELVTVSQFIAMTSEAIGLNAEVIYTNAKSSKDEKGQFPITHRFSTCEKAERFGIVPSVDLCTGLSKTAHWWLESSQGGGIK